jgi:vanillate O-demethylase monooxygenase subunit
MPSQDRISPSAKVRAFPTVEKHRLVWVWPGDPARAQGAAVPDLHWNSDPAWEGDGATLFAKCDYRLLIDNLMDLTHETFVHSTSIGHRAIAETAPTTTHDERTVTVTRWMLDIDAPPFWRTQLQKPGNVDRWQIIRFEAPCISRVLNTITPETDTSCMYFWTLLRNYRLRDQTLTNQLREANARIFEEDRAVVEAQQLALAGGRPMNNLGQEIVRTARKEWSRALRRDGFPPR